MPHASSACTRRTSDNEGMWLSRRRLLGVSLPLLVGTGACVSTHRHAILGCAIHQSTTRNLR
jgi:hypothetical protein